MTTHTEQKCSFASAVIGSKAGCEKPHIEKEKEVPGGSQWICRNCGYVFSVLIKEPKDDR